MNKRLSRLIAKWQKEGSRPQEAFDWSSRLQSWRERFPKQAKFFESVLPLEIDRMTVRAICESYQYDVAEKFLTVMVWGYGDRGYGPYRVEIMLSQPHARAILSKVSALAGSGNPKGAYIQLMQNRIRMLGPSFGTKFLSFCTPRNIGAPIYDSLVALWIAKYASAEFSQVSTNPENWNSKTYFFYLDWIREHADHFECYPDEVELVLFRDAEFHYLRDPSRARKQDPRQWCKEQTPDLSEFEHLPQN